MPYLNFRVDNIASIIEHLKKEKVEILSDIQNFDYGKFATFKDPFDNVIELWEANEEEYRRLVEIELKNYKENQKPMV